MGASLQTGRAVSPDERAEKNAENRSGQSSAGWKPVWEGCSSRMSVTKIRRQSDWEPQREDEDKWFLWELDPSRC